LNQLSSTEIVWAAQGDADRVSRFIDSHWRKGHVLSCQPSLYAWQFKDSRYPNRLSALLAIRGRELVGHLGLIHSDLNLRGRRVAALWTSLWFVMPGAEAAGAGVALMRRAQEEAGGAVGVLRYNREAELPLKAMGFGLLTEVPRWIKMGHGPALAELLDGSSHDYQVSTVDRLREASQRAHAESVHGLEIVDWQRVGSQAWDEVWRRELAPRRLGAWLGADYIVWRYVEHPVYKYHVRVARWPGEQGRINGLMVYRLQDLPDKNCRVLRLLELVGDRRETAGLLGELSDLSAESDVAFVDFHCTSNDLVSQLAEAGFVLESRLPDRLPYLFQPLDFRQEPLPAGLWVKRDDPALAELLDWSRVYITRGLGDQDRPN